MNQEVYKRANPHTKLVMRIMDLEDLTEDQGREIGVLRNDFQNLDTLFHNTRVAQENEVGGLIGEIKGFRGEVKDLEELIESQNDAKKDIVSQNETKGVAAPWKKVGVPERVITPPYRPYVPRREKKLPLIERIMKRWYPNK